LQAPTAWSVEGLLRYLPPQAQDLLFEPIQEMSAVGSQIVANAPTKASAATVPEVVALYRRGSANTDESQPVPSYLISARRVC
jgi:O-methyltransferase involved in polyketide biosynthesis